MRPMRTEHHWKNTELQFRSKEPVSPITRTGDTRIKAVTPGLGIGPVVALVTTDTGPIAKEIATVADGALVQAVLGVRAVSVGRTVSVGVPARSVVARVAGDVAPAAAVVGAMTITATQGGVGDDREAVVRSFRPVDRMPAGAIVTGEATDATGAAHVVGAMALDTVVGAVAAHHRTVLIRGGPTGGMAAARSVMALVTGDAGPIAQVVLAMTGRAGFWAVVCRFGTVSRAVGPVQRMAAWSIVTLITADA